MGETTRLAVLAALLLAFAAGVIVHGQMQQRPIEFFWERPNCNARAYDLPGSLKTPFRSGRTVWACE